MATPDGVSWRDYVDARLAAHDAALAVAKAELDRRLEAMNEFREENRRFASHAIAREVYEVHVTDSERRHQAIEREMDRLQSAIGVWRWLVGFLGIGGLAALLALLATWGKP